MKHLLSLSCLASILFLCACQKEVSLENPDSLPSDNDTDSAVWVLASAKNYLYDLATGEVEETSLQEYSYDTTLRTITLFYNKEPDEKHTYSDKGLLETISYYKDEKWSEGYRFYRNVASELSHVAFREQGATELGVTGSFKIGSSNGNKTIQYIDTSAKSNGREYYTVTFNSAGKPIKKNYEKDADGRYMSDWTSPWGLHEYTYDGNNHLKTILWTNSWSSTINGTPINGYDSTTVTYWRDVKDNGALARFYDMFFGSDLAFWFTKYKGFYGNGLNDGGNSLDGGYVTGYYNYGQPCSKVQIKDKGINSFGLPYSNSEEYIYQNQHDSNGNISCYTMTINGKVSEKWEFTYIKL